MFSVSLSLQSLKGYHITETNGELYAEGTVYNTPDCTGPGWEFKDKSGDCVSLAGGSQRNAWANGVRVTKVISYETGKTGVTLWNTRYDTNDCSGTPWTCASEGGPYPCPVRDMRTASHSTCTHAFASHTQTGERCYIDPAFPSRNGYEVASRYYNSMTCDGDGSARIWRANGECNGGTWGSERVWCMSDASSVNFDFNSVS